MNTQANEGFRTLTDKEKHTLRLMVRGHDAKSIARRLDLSVHTINERLREARRKMAVSSSREAARMLLEAEGGDLGQPDPQLLGDKRIGEDASPPALHQQTAPIGGAGRRSGALWIAIGVLLMTLTLALLALTATPNAVPNAAPPAPPAPIAAQVAPNPEVVDAARQFLTLVDQGRWDDSYRATGAAFRKLNTAAVWAAVSEKVRPPLGALISRTFASQQNLPAPPHGYEVVKFHTSFANQAEAIETVTLEREDDSWRVVGVTIE